MQNAEAILRVAKIMEQAMAARDAQSYVSAYDDDIVIWHNTSRLTQTKAENEAYLAQTMAGFSTMAYMDISRIITEQGYVQQHVLRAELPDGRVVEIPSCLVVKVVDGLVTRIDEYFDPTPVHALMTSG